MYLDTFAKYLEQVSVCQIMILVTLSVKLPFQYDNIQADAEQFFDEDNFLKVLKFTKVR